MRAETMPDGRQQWAAPELQLLNVGDSEKDIVVSVEFTISYGSLPYSGGPS